MANLYINLSNGELVILPAPVRTGINVDVDGNEYELWAMGTLYVDYDRDVVLFDMDPPT